MGGIQSWKSIVTLIVFIIANAIVVFPFQVTIPISPVLTRRMRQVLVKLRILPPKHDFHDDHNAEKPVKLAIPFNFVTAPLIADLFLLVIRAIGRQEVHDGILGINGIVPIDIMAFFFALAYMAISLDATGLIRFLAFWVLKKGGSFGHRLFFYLYAFFFSLGTFIGNDPIILSGTAFLAYLTRVASNIAHPRAWIYSQFAVANISSAIFVSSNPTNLVLAGAFKITFVTYTANMVVPALITAMLLFPFLLYIIFPSEELIPLSIDLHERPEQGIGPDQAVDEADAQNMLSLEEVFDPFLDKSGAVFGGVLIVVTLTTLLATNAAGAKAQVFEVTVPAAFVMLCRDLVFDWNRRHETREIARQKREVAARKRQEIHAANESALPMSNADHVSVSLHGGTQTMVPTVDITDINPHHLALEDQIVNPHPLAHVMDEPQLHPIADNPNVPSNESETLAPPETLLARRRGHVHHDSINSLSPILRPSVDTTGPPSPIPSLSPSLASKEAANDATEQSLPRYNRPTSSNPSVFDYSGGDTKTTNLYDVCLVGARAFSETFPTVSAVFSHLPFALVPFAFSVFILVQALDTSDWLDTFAKGWGRWVEHTGTIGALGGMGLLSVILCNCVGTNIGATILLSRILQRWFGTFNSENPLLYRTQQATVYAMALGVNYGAFSAVFSASLAGLLWRDILSRKHIQVRQTDFARINLPIIAIAMTVGCAVLAAQVYLVKKGYCYWDPDRNRIQTI